ncbi:ATP-binding protein [Pseudonocardia sp. RS010]|uniref:ATP-binding protein n=1 Tax=Pseudonocardia sp. RS010 TaxID=3385979 RepID=UPI0039A341C5
MSVEPLAAGELPSLSVHRLPRTCWGAGYPEILPPSLQTVGCLEVAAMPADPHHDALSAGPRMREIARQVITAAVATSGLDAFELRYRAAPEANRTRVRMYLLAKSYGRDDAAARAVDSALTAAALCLPGDFTVQVAHDVDEVLTIPSHHRVLELQRTEQVTFPQWTFVPSDYYYHLDGVTGDGSGWAAFWRALARTPAPLTVSILVKPTELDPQERDALGGTLTALGLYAHERTDYSLLGHQEHYPADANARIALEAWEERVRHIAGRPVLARVALAGDAGVLPVYAAELAAALHLTRDGSAHPLAVVSPEVRPPAEAEFIRESVTAMEIWPLDILRMWEDESAPRGLRRMQYLYGPDEVASIAVLPVPDEQGVPGVPLSRRADRRRAAVRPDGTEHDGLLLGAALDQGTRSGAIVLPVPDLTRHLLVVGSSGSGKTTTVLSLLVRLWREHRVPFLALEPIKTEYRGLLGVAGLEDLRILTLGRDDLAGFRLNPLEPPPGVRCEVHAGAVMAALTLALPLPTPLPALLEEALELCYLQAGWEHDTTPEHGLTPPTLRALLGSFTEIFERHGYRGEAQNVGVAFRVRLERLLRGGRGRMLDCTRSSDVDGLLAVPTVVEMDELADAEDKLLLSAFLLQRLRAAARRRGASGGALRHVTVIEEAHRLLSAADGERGEPESGNRLRAEAVRAFCEAISELRSSGEGFVLSSQRPTALAQTAVANTGTRIVHRLESAADRANALDDLDAADLDRELTNRLRAGEALVRWPTADEPELVGIVAAEGVDSARTVPDTEVAAHMAEHRRAVAEMLPYRLCTPEVCPSGCAPDVRTRGARAARESESDAREIWDAYRGGAGALLPVVALVAQRCAGAARDTYCACTHLEAGRAALSVSGQDIRGRLAAAIGERTCADAS